MSDGSPLAGLMLKAFDQDVGREDLLGHAITDANGNYQIAYAAARSSSSETDLGGPSLIVRVYSTEDKLIATEDKLIATSKRRRHAKSVDVIKLVVPVGDRIGWERDPKLGRVRGRREVR